MFNGGHLGLSRWPKINSLWVTQMWTSRDKGTPHVRLALRKFKPLYCFDDVLFTVCAIPEQLISRCKTGWISVCLIRETLFSQTQFIVSG